MKFTFTIETENYETAKKIMSVLDEEKKMEKSVPYNISPYARWFDRDCDNHRIHDSVYNLYFLRCQQKYANEKLRNRGYLLLNEVYDMIGIPKTEVGQVVGWLYDERNPVGDNFVDFGIYEDYNAEFINGYTDRVLLDFNVDGNILDAL